MVSLLLSLLLLATVWWDINIQHPGTSDHLYSLLSNIIESGHFNFAFKLFGRCNFSRIILGIHLETLFPGQNRRWPLPAQCCGGSGCQCYGNHMCPSLPRPGHKTLQLRTPTHATLQLPDIMTIPQPAPPPARPPARNTGTYCFLCAGVFIISHGKTAY